MVNIMVNIGNLQVQAGRSKDTVHYMTIMHTGEVHHFLATESKVS